MSSPTQRNKLNERRTTSVYSGNKHIYIGEMKEDDESQITLDLEPQYSHSQFHPYSSKVLSPDFGTTSTATLPFEGGITNTHLQDNDEFEMILYLGRIPSSMHDLDALIVETSLRWRKALLQVVENTTTFKHRKLQPHLQASALDVQATD